MTSRTERIVADSHALLWHLNQSRRLGARARELLQSADRGELQLVVPTIVLAEALWISEKREPGVAFEDIVGHILAMPTTHIAALNLEVLRETRQLPQVLELHDRIIAATAPVYRDTFISRDRQMRGVVETVW